MAVTSGTFNFASPQNQLVISDAYERIGIFPSKLTDENISVAQNSLNFILQSWINKGLNLWTVQQGVLGLTPGQTSYNLPLYTSAVFEVATRTSTRNLGGTPFSSAGGNAASAFDGNSQTSCTQTSANGYISYNWGQSQFSIQMVGVQSNATLNYTLVAEYSFDNMTWFNALTIPAQSYPIGQLLWFVVPVPISANVFRVRETGGATLNIQELYFNSNINDTMMSPVSRQEYASYPVKNQPGRPSLFWLYRQINPILYIWPAPTALYNALYYTYTLQMQDIGNMVNVAQVPTRFIEALTSSLAHKLSVKYSKVLQLDVGFISYLKQLSDEEYGLAAREDRERVPLRMYGDYFQGWSAA